MYKLFFPYDIYERHRKVAQNINSKDTVADIGGELKHLSQFCSPLKIIVANLNTGDVIITKDKLPFPERSFDVVCSIDVLEHIPKNTRENFINQLISISRKRVVLSFPIGTKKHQEHEKKIQIYLRKKGLSVKYLEEHIKYGLPTLDEIKGIIKGRPSEITYSGNIRLSEILFKIFIFDPKIRFLRKFIYYIKLFFNLITNSLLFFLLTGKSYSKDVNRAYLIINIQK